MLFWHISLYFTTAWAAALPQDQPPQPRAWNIGQEVETSSGRVRGTASDWQPNVSQYLGIPYALPPVGELRWAAPQAYKSNTIISADKFSPDCPANVLNGTESKISYDSVGATILSLLGQAGHFFSEDCLTLNVWAKPQQGERKKAVLVWIYGGGFTSGDTNHPAYNGARLANDEDVVVVSVNYRINIFGFPTYKQLPDINLGLLDQRLAVEWVRDNIEKFGGDPSRITLFGQSAGGASVDFYSYAWQRDPIVNGFIPQSGSAPLTPRNSSSDNAWFEASSKAGCGGVEAGEKTLSCMREKSMSEVLDAIITPTGGQNTGFGPRADGKVVFGDYAARLAGGNFIKKPVLIGNTNAEGGLGFLLNGQAGQSNLTVPISPLDCGVHEAAAGRRANNINTWRYIYTGEYPNQDIGVPGAWHGAEIGTVFGSAEYITKRPNTDVQETIMRSMMGAWAGFAKDPENGLVRLGWPLYNPELPSLIELGGVNSSQINFVNRMKWDDRCAALSSGQRRPASV